MPEPDEFLPPEDPLDGYEIRECDEFILAPGPAARNSDGERVPKDQAVLEGRITRILYRGLMDGERTDAWNW